MSPFGEALIVRLRITGCLSDCVPKAAVPRNLSNKTAEELRAEVLADIANMFPDHRLVPAKPRHSLAESKVRRVSWIAPQDACDVD